MTLKGKTAVRFEKIISKNKPKIDFSKEVKIMQTIIKKSKI